MYPSPPSVISHDPELSPSQLRELSKTKSGKSNFTNQHCTQANIADRRTTLHSMLIDMCQAMAEVGMPLLIHGEVTRAGVDIFDKEALSLIHI